AENPQVVAENQTESEVPPPQKRRKTFPFARLLTSEESWQQLQESTREAERKAEEKRQKKEIAAQKKAERELLSAQKKEKRAQKVQKK
ncbi:9712_t:CDS:1, partial [Dentiscutata heterogama]